MSKSDKPPTVKVHKGPCFFTITLPNTLQRHHLKVLHTRPFKIIKELSDEVIPYLKQAVSKYQLWIEISEAMSSDGKYFPRIHFHFIMNITCVISLLLACGKFFEYGYGYNIYMLSTKKMLKSKTIYLTKQHAQWEEYMKNHQSVKTIFNKYQKWKR